MNGVHLGARDRIDRDVIFRLRGLLPLPALLIMIAWSDPTLTSFAVGGGVVLAGILVRFWAAGYIKTYRVSEVQADRLVTAGPYAHVRNPLYTGNLLIGLGYSVIANWWPAYLLCFAVYTYIYSAIIPHEESFLSDAFGEAYTRYRTEVPRLWPRLRPYRGAQGGFSILAAVRGELVTWGVHAAVALLFGVKLIF